MNHLYDEEFLARQAARTRPHRLAFYRRISLGSLSSVLEVGSGSGEIIGEISQRSHALCFAVEPDPDLKEISSKHYPGISFQIGSGEKLPFQDGRFDLVLTHFALMWCQDPRAVIAEMYRVCKSSAWVAALGEADYGGYITHPQVHPDKEEITLKEWGAHTRLGRELSGYFQALTWRELHWGVLGADETVLNGDNLTTSRAKLVFLPIFWVWGRKA